MYRALRLQPHVRPVTASDHLGTYRVRNGLRLSAGSWGANGDYSMWLNSQTAWMWPRIWKLEDRFWTMAREAIEFPTAHESLAQAARELLLLQSSDWQFIVSTGAVVDYGIRRFTGHGDACDRLFGAIEAGLATGDLTSATNVARELRVQDDLFPNVLESVGAVLKGSGAELAGRGMRDEGSG
jgi:1,4-alpha-glucan branching enzyme